MAKVKDEGNGNYSFFCPGCGYLHVYYTQKSHPDSPVWEFNGDMDNPTFTPSLLNRWGKEADPNWQEPEEPGPNNGWSGRCHLFVRDGKIEYCGDCSHHLSGKVVEMKEI